MTVYKIRPFNQDTDADYVGIIALRREITPEHPVTVEEMKDSEKRRDSKLKRGRWIAEAAGTEQCIGFAHFGQSSWSYHPQRFNVGVYVLPGEQEKGVGRTLYETVMNGLAELKPMELHTSAREDWARGLRFAQERGFTEEMREWESCLNVPAFDLAPWVDAYHKPVLNGIEIRSFADLSDDPDRDRKFYELVDQTFRDVPSTVLLTPPPFERFEVQVLQNLSFLPSGVVIAIDPATGAYVGSSELSSRQSDRDLDTGLTGVLRDYRGRGIALALKLRIIEFAQSLGTPVIRTENATTNCAMLSINESLGFVKQPAWIQLARRTPENAVENETV